MNAPLEAIRQEQTLDATAEGGVSGKISTATMIALIQLEKIMKEYLDNEVFWQLHHLFHIKFQPTGTVSVFHTCSIDVSANVRSDDFPKSFDRQLKKFLKDVDRFILHPLRVIEQYGR